MRFFYLISFLLISLVSSGQLTCNNWLSLTSYPSYFRIGDLDISGNKITVEGVLNRTQPYLPGGLHDSEGEIVSKHTDPSNVNYILRPNHAYITTTNGFFGTPDICEIELNKTYHVAMVYDGITLKFYRNGFLMSQVAATGNLIQNNFNTQVGLYDATVWRTQFLGYINEVRIWNVARTQAEIRTYMNSSLPNPTTQTGLQAYYTFDNLLNKQGNIAWNGALSGTASINSTTTNCNFFIDSCSSRINISNIINDYTPVLSLNPCENKITVENANAYNVGDTVLLIQMKGAVIDSTNTAAFGTITDYKNSGNYEFNYVKTKTGNIIELRNTLIRQYDIPTGKVQLVRVPYYQSVNVTSTLTCLPWDGSKGGVLVLNVQDTVELNADINTTGKGFLKGIMRNSNLNSFTCGITDFYLPDNTINAAGKGEGIAFLSSNRSSGKGPSANGGGGGMNTNSGGGGGSNGTIGGRGGYEWNNGCPNHLTSLNWGYPGNNLIYNTASNKVFMGGGGGAGHCNNQYDDPIANADFNGGNGGGLIIINSNYIKNNNQKIISKGDNAYELNVPNSYITHDGMGGGGAGGTVLLNNNNYINNLFVDVSGGKGGNLVAPITVPGFVGPGGGGSGGVIWMKQNNVPANVTITNTGGNGGVIVQAGNIPYGAAPGQAGINVFNLTVPLTAIPFKPNIDSVRFNNAATGCSTFDFEGLGYTNTSPINSWQWYFGDGNTANTQNTSHTYTANGTYTVKLVVTDINGCKDSISRSIIAGSLNSEIIFGYLPCIPQTTIGLRGGTNNPLVPPGNWDFGDGTFATATIQPIHSYPPTGIFTIKHSVSYLGCTDTSVMVFDASIIPENIIKTNDTTICFGTTKQLLAQLSPGRFCWSPPIYLDDPLIQNPITSTPGTIKYYYTADMTGNNLLSNGDFSSGNTGFSSDYTFQTSNTGTTAAYGINTNAQSWNASFGACTDHTTGTSTGNMFLANGATVPGLKAWAATIPVTPGTNYQFSAWIQSISPGTLSTTAGLNLYINNNSTTINLNAPVTNCQWTQVKTNWNSGTKTSVNISLINNNIGAAANDFALDDIFFGPVFLKRDSVTITVDTALVVATNSTTICESTSIQLNATGASTYSWTSGSSLNNPNIANPIATPITNTRYIVSGTTTNGCVAKDTVDITINPKPLITKSNNDTICVSNSAQLLAAGGVGYSWSPAASLNNPSIPNPVATPTSTTKYFVTVTGANTCSNIDSIEISVRTPNSFTINPPVDVCRNSAVQLNASGGDTYAWQPATTLDNPLIPNPFASPQNSSTYSVVINDTLCGFSRTLSTIVTVLPLPIVRAAKSNDIDCSSNQSQLNATGTIQYSWSPAATLNNASAPNPIATPLATTKYVVSGTAVSGCTNYDSVTVNVNFTDNANYLMPTAFTPNNDGKNDCYGVKFWGIVQEIDFSIYNRWGERVFHSTKVGDCWNGMYKGVQQNTAVFIYVIRAKTTCQPTVFRKGTFALIR